jgi:hypothetical protein
VLGWIALGVLAAAGVYVVIRLLRSWGAASRRYGAGSAPPGGDGPSDDGPPDGAPSGPGPA